MVNLLVKDIVILCLTKILRMFAFGAISVVFIESLVSKGIEVDQIGYLQSMIAVGDTVISLYLTTRADKIGRKKILILSACLKIFSGVSYAMFNNFILLAISGILGVLTVNGGEIGPFLPVEQAAITQIIENQANSEEQMKKYTAKAFGIYNMFSYLAQAAGNFAAGLYISFSVKISGGARQDYYSHILMGYAIFGAFKFICYMALSSEIEADTEKKKIKQIVNCAGLTASSTKVISLLSVLFFVDAFAGGFVAQSFLSFYYEQKYSLQLDSIGGILSICNIVGGLSGLASSYFVAKIGAMTTMIVTHLPSNILLILIALVHDQYWAVILLMLRFCISQMDVPARQTYVSMVVSSGQRSAANGITNIVRSVGVALAFPIAGQMWKEDPQSFLFSLPFLLAGGLKCFYDITLGFCFLKEKCHKAIKKPQGQFKQLEEVEVQSNSQIQTQASKDKE